MATKYQTGNMIDYTPDAAVTAGDVVDLSGSTNCLIGIADNDIAASTLGALTIKGVYKFALATGKTFSQSDSVYIDSSGDATDDTSETYAGIAVQDNITGYVYVDINVAPVAVAGS